MATLALGSPAGQATGPIGYWKLDDTASPAEDSIATADGIWNGPVTAVNDVKTFIPPGPITNCGSVRLRSVTAAGAVNYVSLGRSAALDNVQNGSFTLSAWFKANSIPAGTGDDTQYGIVLKTGLHEGLSLAGNGFVMGHWIGTNPGDYYSAGYGTTTVTVGVWQHVAGVVDTTNHEVRLYVNGSPPPFNQTAPIPAGATGWAGYVNEPWLIGINNPAGGSARYQADGTVDDVRIYDRALSTTEIQTLANGGLVGDPAQPSPGTPQNLQATGATNQVSLTWDTVAGATSYNVKRSISSLTEGTIATVTTNSYLDTPLTGGPYFYAVSALIRCSEGSNSVEVSASPQAPIPPAPRTSRVGKENDPCGCGSAIPKDLGLTLLAALAFLVYGATRRSQART